MELESVAGRRIGTQLPYRLEDDGAGGWVLDPLPLLVTLGERRQRGEDVEDLAAAFHATVAAATGQLVLRAGDATGRRTVVLSGGVFQNALLLRLVSAALDACGLEVLVPRVLSPNDGAISYGQAAAAAAMLSRESAP